MNHTKTIVKGISEVTEKYIERRGWFLIFPITWHEKVSTTHMGNDIFIETDHEIRNICLNGVVYKVQALEAISK